jgi:hypothetical protein
MKRFVPSVLLFGLLAGCSTFMRDRPTDYMVFFPSSEIVLSADARAVVDQAAAAIRGTHPQSVILAAGVASGDNLKLAGPRVDAVRDALVADGVSADLIARSSLPDTALEIRTNGDQRVEIKLVAKPVS